MQPRTTDRTESLRRARSFALLTPEGEFTLTVDSRVLGDGAADGGDQPVPELPGRDGLDFRHPGYLRGI